MIRNSIYYSVKPIIPRFFRLGVRRFFARRKYSRCSHIWPIDETAANQPENWAGWPEEKDFSVVLTHDVEGPKGLDQVRPLAELEESLGFRSSFNFVPEGSYSVPRSLREDLDRRGFEVGVHDLKHDGKLYASKAVFKDNARRINGYLRDWKSVGFRSGFMLRNLDWLHELDKLYDASTFDTDPFEPQPDGANTIFPFWVRRKVRAEEGKAGNLDEQSAFREGYVELPYTLAQDSTLFLLLREDTIAIWKRKIDWLVGKGGMILVNVHPDYIDFSESPKLDHNMYPVKYYKDLLVYLNSLNRDKFWHGLPREIASYFKETMIERRISG